MAPWKAIHFPLPAQFEPPCTNMILTITGFEDRDRDYAKVRESHPDQTLYSIPMGAPPSPPLQCCGAESFFFQYNFIRDSRFGLLTTVLSPKIFLFLKLKDSLGVPE
jgi:hypothetical protein